MGFSTNKLVSGKFGVFLLIAALLVIAGKYLLWDPLRIRDAIKLNDMLAAADVKSGFEISKGCTACHSIEKGGPNKIGPSLFGIVGARIASQENYEYSYALTSMKDKIWTTDALYDWLRDPSDYAPGTKMSFAGLLDPQDRMDLIAYLMTLK